MENYAAASESRMDDFDVLSSQRKKVASIHFGGIYIECLLKAILCEKYAVTESPRGKWLINGTEYGRPGHELQIGAYRELESIFDDMSEDVQRDFEDICRPNGKNYIDYRYISETEISDDEYEDWMNHFISVYGYLMEAKKSCMED